MRARLIGSIVALAGCFVAGPAAAAAAGKAAPANDTPKEAPTEAAEAPAPAPSAPPEFALPEAKRPPMFSTGAWCADAATVCWEDRWVAFSGLRFLFDMTPGWLVQGGDDRFQSNELATAMRIGLETNLVKGIMSAQFAFITPFEARLDQDSRTVREGRLPSGDVSVDFGFSAALGFFDGMISVGGGVLSYDTRLLDNATTSDLPSGFGFVSFNPLSAVRWAIKTAALY